MFNSSLRFQSHKDLHIPQTLYGNYTFVRNYIRERLRLYGEKSKLSITGTYDPMICRYVDTYYQVREYSEVCLSFAGMLKDSLERKGGKVSPPLLSLYGYLLKELDEETPSKQELRGMINKEGKTIVLEGKEEIRRLEACKYSYAKQHLNPERYGINPIPFLQEREELGMVEFREEDEVLFGMKASLILEFNNNKHDYLIKRYGIVKALMFVYKVKTQDQDQDQDQKEFELSLGEMRILYDYLEDTLSRSVLDQVLKEETASFVTFPFQYLCNEVERARKNNTEHAEVPRFDEVTFLRWCKEKEKNHRYMEEEEMDAIITMIHSNWSNHGHIQKVFKNDMNALNNYLFKEIEKLNKDGDYISSIEAAYKIREIFKNEFL